MAKGGLEIKPSNKITGTFLLPPRGRGEGWREKLYLLAELYLLLDVCETTIFSQMNILILMTTFSKEHIHADSRILIR